MYKNYSEAAKDALRRTASSDQAVRENAMKAFAAKLQEPLRQGIFDRDNLGEIYEKQVLDPGVQATYPLDFIQPGTEDDYSAFAMPKQGRIPERHVEADELTVPTFRIANAIDWDIQFAKDARFDVIMRAIRVYEAGFVRKINSDGWHTILGAADGRGLIVTAGGAAAFTGATTTATPAAGQLTKELLSRMQTAMTRGAGGNANSGRLTDFYFSLEGMEDIRAWNADEIDEVTRRDIFVNEEYGLATIYGTVLHAMTEFGEGQEYQTFLTSTLSASLPSVGGTARKEWCVGLDLSTMDSFVMPIREELQTFDDPGLYRQLRMGVYGFQIHGFSVLDGRRVILGAF